MRLSQITNRIIANLISQISYAICDCRACFFDEVRYFVENYFFTIFVVTNKLWSSWQINYKIMEAVIEKWGNGLGIKIPNFLIRELKLKDGISVKIRDVGQEIRIQPRPKKRLIAMLDGITEANIHELVDTGTPVGNEIW
jgi:antitoxin MazE